MKIMKKVFYADSSTSNLEYRIVVPTDYLFCSVCVMCNIDSIISQK